MTTPLLQLMEASRQLLGALKEEDWELAQLLVVQRQHLAEEMKDSTDSGKTSPAPEAELWQEFLQLEAQIRALLARKKPASPSAKARKLAAIAGQTNSTD